MEEVFVRDESGYARWHAANQKGASSSIRTMIIEVRSTLWFIGLRTGH
jgi:hypothetical protein